MTHEYRGHKWEEGAMDRWWRDRWAAGSLWVLDVDRVLCRPDLRHGLIVEEKHVDALGRQCTLARSIARRLGWWAALLVYTTDTGNPFVGTTTSVDLTLWAPDGTRYPLPSIDEARFNDWVVREFGARPRETEATCQSR